MASRFLPLSGRALGARGSSQVTGTGGDTIQLAMSGGLREEGRDGVGSCGPTWKAKFNCTP
jgi:hypothetical protein